MMGRKMKNSGMTLVEVLVSMLVLSIAAVTVISAFSAAAQVNTKAKRMQGAEALMENMLEYAEAGGKDFKGWFLVADADYQVTPSEAPISPAPGATPTPVPPVKTEELKNVDSGFQKYTVKVTTNTEPTGYEASDLLNKSQKVIQFGDAGSNAILIDASDTTNDSMVCDMFYGMHVSAVTVHNAEELAKEEEAAENGETYYPNLWTEKSLEDVKDLIDREIWIKSEATGTPDKYRLVGYTTFIVDDSLELGDGAVERTYKIPLCTSEEFDKKDESNPSTKELSQIYLMYSESLESDSSRGNDIRFWDPEGMLDVNLYVAKQVSALKDVTDTYDQELDDWFTTGDEVIITCKDPDTNVLQRPVAATIYSSLDRIVLDGSTSGDANVKLEPKLLVAKDEDIKVEEITIEIIDPGTGKIVMDETIIRLH